MGLTSIRLIKPGSAPGASAFSAWPGALVPSDVMQGPACPGADRRHISPEASGQAITKAPERNHWFTTSMITPFSPPSRCDMSMP